MPLKDLPVRIAAASLGTLCMLPLSGAASWEPSRPIELIVPAGTGGGADQMARTIQGILRAHGLVKQEVAVINRTAADGSEGILSVHNAGGNPHRLLVAQSLLLPRPTALTASLGWNDFTPIALIALDHFVLWVNARAPYQSARDLIEAARAGEKQVKVAGTGTKQDDELVTAIIEQKAGVKFTYVPARGGGEVALQLVGNRVQATVNNPIEAVEYWRSGDLRPLCVFSAEPLPYSEPIAQGRAWSDIPTCKSEGLAVEHQTMRGLFMAPGVTAEQSQFYIGALGAVRETPEWQAFMRQAAFNPAFVTGPQFAQWVAQEERRQKLLMQQVGLSAAD